MTLRYPPQSHVLALCAGVGFTSGWTRMPLGDTFIVAALLIFCLVMVHSIIAALRLQQENEEVEAKAALKNAARGLRNRPGRYQLDNSTMPPPLNKGKRDVKYRRTQ